MTDTTTDPSPPAAPDRVPPPDKAGALARLAEIRTQLAPVADLQAERLWLLLRLRDEDRAALDEIAAADGSNTGAVRTSLSKARKADPPLPTPPRYQPPTS